MSRKTLAESRLDEIRRLQRYVGVEFNLIRRHFPAIDELLAELIDLIDASDPQTSRPVAGGSRGGAETDGTETRGSEEGGYGDVTMRGGFAVRATSERVHEINRRLRTLARDVFSGLDGPTRRYGGRVNKQYRRCRYKECPDVGRNQWGMKVEGVFLCRTCRRELTGRTA